MNKLKSKNTRFSNPFDGSVKKTERTGVAILMHWMRNIIEENHLDLGLPDVETSGSDRKMPDLVIYESRKSQNVLVLIEAKPPYFNVFDEEELKEPARKKANKRQAKYFATTNFKKLLWYNTAKANNPIKFKEEEQLVEKYFLSEIENLDYIEQPRYKESIKKAIKIFLIHLIEIHSGKKQEPKHPIDEFLIYRLHEKIRVLTLYYKQIIRDEFHKNIIFRKKLGKWFFDQGWSIGGQENDFEKAARQTAYLLVNKILFYDVLQSKRPDRLDPLDIPRSLTKGSLLKNHLSGYFNEVLKIDYETIYDTDFIDTIAFPDSKEVVKEIKELIKVLKQYNFSKIGYDIIGRLFERLIPLDERHILGQYFTKADVVDLILKFCLHHENDKIIDPACGAGTFLVRAYHHKKLMNNRLEHEKILTTLWGVDIAKFPAHLSQINLAIKKLESEKNYPNILKDDFFKLLVGPEGFEPIEWRKRIAKTLSAKERKIEHPRWFDAIVGNPPYTRHEEIEGISEKDKYYKNKIIQNSLKDEKGKIIAQISKRAGIHAYFFVHGTKFLKDGGYFGFIVSNSWLDTDYGRGLQELFLKYYKIVAIIESKVERWFEEADVNTCIVILQKCKNKKERDNNLARFVYLKKPLRHFIPPATNIWEAQIERLQAIDSLKKTILSNIDIYENDELRIYPIKQIDLWKEGYNTESNKYTGAKWGKYLRAPEIFFKIFTKCKTKLSYLSKEADIETYLNTGGADGFFITKFINRKGNITKIKNVSKEGANKIFNIESRFVKRFIKSPREINKIKIDKTDAKWSIIIPQNQNLPKYISEYIKWGESKGFNKRSGTIKRNPWWLLPKQVQNPGIILWNRLHDETHIVHYNPLLIANTNFYFIKPKSINEKVFVAFLNSTFFAFLKEFSGRVNFGQGVLKTEGSDLKKFICIKSKLLKKYENNILETFNSFSNRDIMNIFDELGAGLDDSVSFDKVKTDRRKIDKIIMEDILGLTEQEQLEIYRAVIDLVGSRLKKAKSVKNNNKNKDGLDINLFVKNILEKIGKETLGDFYRNKILTQDKTKKITLPKLKAGFKPFIDEELMGWRIYYSNKDYIICDSEEEARFIKIFLDKEMDELIIPREKKYLSNLLNKLEKLNEKIENIIEESLEFIYQKKLKENLRSILIREIMK